MHTVAATAPGFTHVNPGQPGKINNQDALATRESPKGLVAVLCDGCSSQPFSGTGADIGANLIAGIINKKLLSGCEIEKLDWTEITNETSRLLKTEIRKFTLNDSVPAFEKAAIERFSFTAIVLVITGDIATVASFGDGLVIIDDEVIDLQPPILNSPPYLCYLLVQKSAYHTEEFKQYLEFNPIRTLQLSSLAKGLIIGTDGLAPLASEDLHHPALVQPRMLQNWLNAQTTEKLNNGTFVLGKCKDDVTLMIIRTEEAQKRLFANRSKIAQLKQMISDLEALIKELDSDLTRTRSTMLTLKEKIRELETNLEEVEAKATALNSFESKVATLRTQVEKLRREIDKKYQPVLVPVKHTPKHFDDQEYYYDDRYRSPYIGGDPFPYTKSFPRFEPQPETPHQLTLPEVVRVLKRKGGKWFKRHGKK